jgi:phosphoglycerate dehydrogenase-like enzyme
MKVLVTSKSFGKYAPEALGYLREHGFEVSFISRPSPSSAQILAEIGDSEALIVGNDPVDRELLEKSPHLRLVHMNGTGLDAIDVQAASELGVLVANAPGANRNAVAELTLALMLVAGRGIERHAQALRTGAWERSAGHELSGKTVGLVGLGNIGKRIVELLGGFSVKIVAYDPFGDPSWAAAHGVELETEVDAVFKAADYLALTLPLTEETQGLANGRRIGLMKPDAYLINTARGGLVDDGALIAAVREQRIAGAALDAFSEEPLPLDSPLRIPGITLTPHLAATSIETAMAMSTIVAHNIVDILVDGKIEKALNIEAARAAGKLTTRQKM